MAWVKLPYLRRTHTNGPITIIVAENGYNYKDFKADATPDPNGGRYCIVKRRVGDRIVEHRTWGQGSEGINVHIQTSGALQMTWKQWDQLCSMINEQRRHMDRQQQFDLEQKKAKKDGKKA